MRCLETASAFVTIAVRELIGATFNEFLRLCVASCGLAA